MADIFLTLKQIESLFWNVTTQMLGLDPALPINANKVRIAWPTTGAPAWKIDEDVVFIRMGDADDPINVQRDVTTSQSDDDDNANQATSYTRVLMAQWVCYGPNSFDNAFMIRNNLYKQKYRDLLNINQVFLIPQINSPVRSPELFSGQWWERANVTAKFNELLQFNETVPYLKSVTTTVTVGQNSPAFSLMLPFWFISTGRVTTENVEITSQSPETGVHILTN